MPFALATFDPAFLTASDRPVLVDFWSPNCGACKLVMPAVEDLAEKYLGQVWIVKAQAELCGDSITSLKVDKLPTFLMFKGGKEVDRLEGAARWDVLNQFIGNHA